MNILTKSNCKGIFLSAGFGGPAALNWILFKSLGWMTYSSLEHARSLASVIRESGLFDETYYVSNAAFESQSIFDYALHYVLVGEALRVDPSTKFSPAYYAARNPDIVDARMNLLIHYIYNGSAEGRLPRPCDLPELSRSRYDDAKKTVGVVVHEASRTGAPVLGLNIVTELAKKYNVISIVLGPGSLVENFREVSSVVYGPLPQFQRSPAEVGFLMSHVLRSYRLEYIIVNSVESRAAILDCVRGFVPSILLVHEFASYYPPHTFDEAFSLATEVVFPAHIVARSQSTAYEVLKSRQFRILPQGMSVLPKSERVDKDEKLTAANDVIEKCRRNREFVVLGAGTVQIRKGVDLFVSVAAACRKYMPNRSMHFIWIGHGYDPEKDTDYSSYLKEQIDRSGLEDAVTMLDPIDDLESLYDAADAFLLSSRVDPLPNVSIDSAMRGIPVVCFRDASGFAELLEGTESLGDFVVDHLDVDAAARSLVKLVNEEATYESARKNILALAAEKFAMGRYVEKLDTVAIAAKPVLQRMKDDADLLESSDVFDQATHSGRQIIAESRREAIARYLAGIATRTEIDLECNGVFRRRGAAGFNAIEYLKYSDQPASEDALAAFIRAGKPRGPWMPEIIVPTQLRLSHEIESNGGVAIHGHFHYPELFADFLRRLVLSSYRVDLFISTTSEESARWILGHAKAMNVGTIAVQVVPNQGRDIGPFVTAFAGDLEKYEIVGHFHGKRSASYDTAEGDVWREFLWQNLLGTKFPMVDLIIDHLRLNPKTGLVYASDPNMVGWTTNREITSAFLERLDVRVELPSYVEFPNGNMFWCRSEALRALLRSGLTWDDYPKEPIAYDGTLLHAIERSLGLIAAAAGFDTALTSVPGVMR